MGNIDLSLSLLFSFPPALSRRYARCCQCLGYAKEKLLTRILKMLYLCSTPNREGKRWRRDDGNRFMRSYLQFVIWAAQTATTPPSDSQPAPPPPSSPSGSQATFVKFNENHMEKFTQIVWGEMKIQRGDGRLDRRMDGWTCNWRCLKYNQNVCVYVCVCVFVLLRTCCLKYL